MSADPDQMQNSVVSDLGLQFAQSCSKTYGKYTTCIYQFIIFNINP